MDELDSTVIEKPVGRVESTEPGYITVSGLSENSRSGDRIRLGPGISCEFGVVSSVGKKSVKVLCDAKVLGLAPHDIVFNEGPLRIRPCNEWLGRIIDANGEPLDGRPLPLGVETHLHANPPNPTLRRSMGEQLHTGIAVIDTLLPLARGQRVGILAGAGVGKSTLLLRLTANIPSGVVVFAMIGERGREVSEVFERTLPSCIREKTVLVAATSDAPALSRRQAALTAVSVAEAFRKAGRQVLLVVDSMTRVADAHREISVAAGEPALQRGYPSSLTAFMASLIERTGTGAGSEGDITAIFSVLMAGDDDLEPVSDILKGQLDGHIQLTRAIAEEGRYPAIDVLKSLSRSLPEVVGEKRHSLISKARAVISQFEKSRLMISTGLYNSGDDPELDQAIEIMSSLTQLLEEQNTPDIDTSFQLLTTILMPKDQRKETVEDCNSDSATEPGTVPPLGPEDSV